MIKELRKVSVFLVGVLIFNISVPVLYAMDSSKSEVEVEVYVNEYDEEYIKNVEFDDGTKVGDYDYSIKYISNQPSLARINTSLGTYFSYAAWIKRDGVVSLSLAPKDNVRGNKKTKDTAWNIVKNPKIGFGGDNAWKNEKTMKWQYDCHYSFANDKDRWNLEPHRNAKSYAAVVLAKCNP